MDYLYKYADGTTGSSPFQKDASGNFMQGSGGLIEGSFLGTADGKGGYTPGLSNQAVAGAIGGTLSPAASGGGGYSGDMLGGGGGGGMSFSTGNNAFPGGSTSSGGGGSNYMAQTNPYLQQQMDAVTKTMTGNFNRNVLPSISSQAMAAGGFGGSRQGVIEANASNDFNQQLGGALAGLGNSAFGQQLQYDLGRRNNDLGYYNAANSYDLGRGNLGLGYANLDRGINNDNNQWALQGANLANNTWNQLNNNNQTGINAGTNIQNTPMDYLNGFTNLVNGVGRGYSTSTESTNTNGNPLLGAIGGMDLGSRIGNLWGGGGGGGSGGSGLGLKGPSTGFWSTP
jgi:hypothetical protein